MSSDVPSPSAGKMADGLAFLENVTKFRIALLLMSITLAADIAMSCSGRGGVLALNWGMLQSSITIGEMVVFLVAYSMFMAILAIGLRLAMEALWFTLQSRFPFLSAGDRFWRNRDPKRHVFPSAVRSLAIREKDPFAMKVYEDHMRDAAQWRKQWEELVNLSFSCAFLIGLDLWLPDGRSSLGDIRHLLASHADTWGGRRAGYLFDLLWLVVAAPWCVHLYRPDGFPDWIDYPPAVEATEFKC